MEVIKTDIAILGGGGAGLRAAIAVAEQDPTLRSLSFRKCTQCAATR